MAGEKPQGRGCWCCWWRRAKKLKNQSPVNFDAMRASQSPSSSSDKKSDTLSSSSSSSSSSSTPQRSLLVLAADISPLALGMAAVELSSAGSPTDTPSLQTARLNEDMLRLSKIQSTSYDDDEAFIDVVDRGHCGVQRLSAEELDSLERESNVPYESPFKKNSLEPD